jgi:hypothetical protein
MKRLGMEGVVLPDVTVVHFGGVSSQKLDRVIHQRSRFDALFRYFRTHHPVQYPVLCVAWPLRWLSSRKRSSSSAHGRIGI